MQFRLEHPAYLTLALLAVPSAIIAWRGFRSMSGVRRFTAAFARTALLLLLASVVAGVSFVRTTDRVAVIAVVDVSESVRRFVQGSRAGAPKTLDRVRDFLALASTKRRPDDLLGVVAFDGRPIPIAAATRADVTDRTLDVHAAQGTNIADALEFAATLVPPEAAGRLVLISDGAQTAGDAEAAARLLSGGSVLKGARSIPVDVIALEYDITREVIVESADAPPRAAPDAPVTLRVVIWSTHAASGRLSVLDNGTPVDADPGSPALTRKISLSPGRNVVTVELPLGAERIHRFEAVVEPDAGSDTLPDNNRAETFTITPGRGKVLIADGVSAGDEAGPGATLAGLLRSAGLEVRLVPASGIPADLLSLQEIDLVILQNVPSDAVPEATQRALVTHVRDVGAGLVMIGGPDSFGAGGWRGSPLEPILPVKLDLPDKLIVPEIAIVFVIDNSGSMGRPVMGSSRSQQDIANEAVALAMRSLDKQDLVGVVTFNSDASTVVALGPNTLPESTTQEVLAIGSGGGTNLTPGLELAAAALAPADAKIKHVIVLSDGKSKTSSEQLSQQAAVMAAKGIKVSTIAVGDGADLAAMESIAASGGGVYYQVVDPSLLPRIFLKAIRIVRTPMIREVPFTPILTPSGSALTAGLDQPPQLGGLSLTQARSDPLVTLAMITPEAEPVLAHWPVELGQVAAFTSDAHKWAQKWLAWPGYRRFWTQTVRTLSRPLSRPGFTARVEQSGDAFRVQFEALAEDRKPLDDLTVPATVYAPDGKAQEISLSQVGPGLYEGVAAADQTGSYIAVVKPAAAGKRLPPAIAGATRAAGVESRVLKSNRALLERIAGDTGGRVLALDGEAVPDLFDRAGLKPHEAYLPIWRTLLAWAIVALLLDIATRRVAWDRFISRQFGADLAKEAAESVRDRGAQVARTIGTLRTIGAQEPAPAGPVLSDQDASELQRAAADRRRQMRLAEISALRQRGSSGAQQAGETPPESQPEDQRSGLSQAKRRARERFEED